MSTCVPHCTFNVWTSPRSPIIVRKTFEVQIHWRCGFFTFSYVTQNLFPCVGAKLVSCRSSKDTYHCQMQTEQWHEFVINRRVHNIMMPVRYLKYTVPTCIWSICYCGIRCRSSSPWRLSCWAFEKLHVYTYILDLQEGGVKEKSYFTLYSYLSIWYMPWHRKHISHCYWLYLLYSGNDNKY